VAERRPVTDPPGEDVERPPPPRATKRSTAASRSERITLGMPPLRYFILARNGSDVVELFKLEQVPDRIVIASSLIPSIVETGNIHVTHHPPKRGMSTRIVHISDARGTDVKLPLDPAAEVVDLAHIAVNLTDMDWEKARKFTKQSYAETVVLDVGADGEHVDAQFVMGEPRLVKETLETRRKSDSLGKV
jgi:hypothetical protein